MKRPNPRPTLAALLPLFALAFLSACTTRAAPADEEGGLGWVDEVPQVEPVVEQGELVLADGATLSGHRVVEGDVRIPAGATVLVPEDLWLRASGDVTVDGTLRAVDREAGAAELDAPRLDLRSARTLRVTGRILGGSGGDALEGTRPGGDGSRIVLRGEGLWVAGEVRGGDGGDGHDGGKGGAGGSVATSGAAAPRPGDAGGGQLVGGAGGAGGKSSDPARASGGGGAGGDVVDLDSGMVQ